MPPEEPVRRRSTVRERAPIGGAEDALPPSQTQQPVSSTPEPVVTESSEAAESRSAAPHRMVVAPFRRRLNGGSQPVKSAWVDRDAEAIVAQLAKDLGAKSGIDRDLALRIYTTRLLGRDPKLVLHGGGNTSLKTRMRDRLGEDVEVLRVKSSGSDMASIGAGRFRRRTARSDAQAARARSRSATKTWSPSSAPI